jgi:Domain of unknown function (DUF5054)
MKRREFIKSSLLSLGGVALARPLGDFSLQSPQAAPAPDPAVKRVLVMFKCHFDAGFVDTQAAVVEKYFSEYFPLAIRVANQMRESGSYRYVWTTGSWLLYEYLEQATPEERRAMEIAIAAGDIAWHAIPFTWQTELMDASMIAGGIAISKTLDRRFGRTTTGAKMTDVPGHTRGLIAPLAAQGVKFLDIGVNGASTPAELPPMFNWRLPGGASLAVMYHAQYGGVSRVPGSDLAIAIVVRGDNKGPHTPEEIAKTYSDLGAQFPSAKIIPTSLTEIANAVESHCANLPVVTQEIGDTWIYGVSSDPLKLARFREVARLRREWISQKQFQLGDATDVALLQHLLLDVEHTWGRDTKPWLDFDHYSTQELAATVNTEKYQTLASSWGEKRKNIFDGIAMLPTPLHEQARVAVAGLEAKEPRLATGSKLLTAEKEIETKHFIVGLDPVSGAINRLQNKSTRRGWAAAERPLAQFSYQTFSKQDYDQFFSNYVLSSADWAIKDFGKFGIENSVARSQTWFPSLADVQAERDGYGFRVLARLEIHDEEALRVGRAAFPQKLYLELILPDADPVVNLNFYWFGKSASRIPEALWLTFNPVLSSAAGWMMEKSGEPVSPLDVVVGGGRHMHAVGSGFSVQDKNQLLKIEILDAPLIALGEKSPLNFSRSQADISGGIHCNLFNNAWGTNYIMWYGEDMRFRFEIRG